MSHRVTIRIPIEVNIESMLVFSAAYIDMTDVPEVVRELDEKIQDAVPALGLTLYNPSHPSISRRNDGFSLYRTYYTQTDTLELTAVLDIRVSDHSLKPDLEKGSKNHEAFMDKAVVPKLKKELHQSKKNSLNVSLVDVNYKSGDWGVEIYIGSDGKYTSPITDVDRAVDVLIKKLSSVLSKYM